MSCNRTLSALPKHDLTTYSPRAARAQSPPPCTSDHVVCLLVLSLVGHLPSHPTPRRRDPYRPNLNPRRRRARLGHCRGAGVSLWTRFWNCCESGEPESLAIVSCVESCLLAVGMGQWMYVDEACMGREWIRESVM